MLVSSGKGKNFIRGEFKTDVCLNGSFIDLFFDDGGRRRCVAILRSDLERMMALKSQGENFISSIGYDIPADEETCLTIFDKMRSQVRERIENEKRRMTEDIK